MIVLCFISESFGGNLNETQVIKLSQDLKALEEVVVVGYSVQKKRDVLGAISKVNNEELNKTPNASVQQALQGRVAGVSIESQTGAPGAPVSVRIRGVGSINASNEPLYIVDGIPVEGALNNISPNDIENITVLKDASSAAIYASRATNGVILITTKRGKSGKTKVSYNTQMGYQIHGHLTPMANTEEYIQLYNEAAKNDNTDTINQRTLIEGSWIKDFPNVNHLEEIFQTAPLQTHEISISGGNDKTQYLISGNIFRQTGIIKGTHYDRYRLRSNINSEVKKWLKVGLNIGGGISDNRLVSSSGNGAKGEGGSVVRYALYRNPAIPVYDNNGNFVDLPSEYYGNVAYNTFFGDGYSPEGLCVNTDRTKKNKNLLINGDFTLILPANLLVKTTAGIDYNNNILRVWNKTWGTANRINAKNGLELSNGNSFSWTTNSTLNHSISFNKRHSISSMLGYEAIKTAYENFSGSESEFLNTDPIFLFLGFGSSNTRNHQSRSEFSLLSFFGNINYNYMQRFYLSGILRRDGSSKFSKENQWGTFYSLSTGWNMEEEEFIKKLKIINKLKLRIGYGAIGNQGIPLYSYLDRMGYGHYYAFGNNSYNGYAQTQLGNINLKWETSKQFNIGIDLELFAGMFGITLDYYYKTTKDMLIPASIPPSSGNSIPPYINTDGTVLNSGIDVEIFYRRKIRNGGFNIILNGGYLRNKVLNIASPYYAGIVDTGVYATKTETRYPLGSFYLYEMDGIFQNDMEILTSAYQGSDIKPGDVKYVDQNKDHVIDYKDRKYLGSAIPTLNIGLNLSANYRNFDMSLFFQGAFGQKIFSQVNFDIEGFYRGFDVTKRYYNERWTGEGTSNTQPRASWAAKSNNVKASSRFLEDGSYLRMKNLQIGYTVPNTKEWGVDNLRIYIGATNLLTFTQYSGLDPEMTVSTNSLFEGDIAKNIDWGTYPVAKNFTLGINFTF